MQTDKVASIATETGPGAPARSRRRPLRLGLAGIAAVALLLTACLTEEQSTATTALNADRQANSRRVLPTQDDAQVKAQKWAERLARDNRLYHSTLSDGIATRWCSLGENVGYSSSIKGAEAGFMQSTVHRTNILNAKWNGVGVGVAHNGNRVYVVQVFITTC